MVKWIEIVPKKKALENGPIDWGLIEAQQRPNEEQKMWKNQRMDIIDRTKVIEKGQDNRHKVREGSEGFHWKFEDQKANFIFKNVNILKFI